MECATIKVQGKVQGVWFRDYVKRCAIRLDIKGWVKNNIDGTVGAEVEGKKEIIEDLIELIKIGSPMSRVDNVSVEWKKELQNYELFIIIR